EAVEAAWDSATVVGHSGGIAEESAALECSVACGRDPHLVHTTAVGCVEKRRIGCGAQLHGACSDAALICFDVRWVRTSRTIAGDHTIRNADAPVTHGVGAQ